MLLTALLTGMISIVAPCIILMLPIYAFYLDQQTITKKQFFVTTIGILIGVLVIGILFKLSITTITQFIQFRYVLISILILIIIKEYHIIKFPRISLPIHSKIFQLGSGLVIALSWVPCISYFYLPLILNTSHYSLLQSLLVYLAYGIGILTPIYLLTFFENQLLLKLRNFSILNQKIIKIIALLILITTLFILFIQFH